MDNYFAYPYMDSAGIISFEANGVLAGIACGTWTDAVQCIGGAIAMAGAITGAAAVTGGLGAALIIGSWTMGGLNMGVGCGKWLGSLK